MIRSLNVSFLLHVSPHMHYNTIKSGEPPAMHDGKSSPKLYTKAVDEQTSLDKLHSFIPNSICFSFNRLYAIHMHFQQSAYPFNTFNPLFFSSRQLISYSIYFYPVFCNTDIYMGFLLRKV